jgi:hypothetical protein
MKPSRRTVETIASLFAAGRPLAVAEASLLWRGGYQPDPDSLPWVASALAQLGQVREAEMLVAQQRSLLPDEGRLVALFHVVHAYCRLGRYAEARRIVGQLAAQRRAVRDGGSWRAAFYGHACWTSLGWATGRLRSARRALAALEAALALAPSDSAAYERFLANDLGGHVLALSGNLDEGLCRLRAAETVAEQLGRTASVSAAILAQALYEARYGSAPRAAIARLTAARVQLVKISAETPVVTAALGLELARQHLLASDGPGARQVLAGVAAALVPSPGRRFEAAYHLRLAELAAFEGTPAAAYLHATAATRSLDASEDPLPLAEALAHEVDLLRRLGQTAASALVARRLAALERRTAYRVPAVPATQAASQPRQAPSNAPVAPVAPLAPRPEGVDASALNLRQTTLLDELAARAAIDVHQYRRRFDVSEITACRDLAGLTRAGFLQRVGKARATRYVRV